MEYEEKFADTWKNEKHEWMDFVKNDVLKPTFSIARYSRAMESLTGFWMKVCVSLPALRWNFVESIGKETDETIHTYKAKYTRSFVRQSVKGGRCGVFNQKLVNIFLKVNWKK